MTSAGHKSSTVLSVFFGTEMWERYGFYVVQSLLALYLSLQLHISDAQTYVLVGSFTALAYISPVIGGWIADHCLGQKRAVFLGAGVLFLSYIVVAFSLTMEHLIISLAGIAIGTGLLKPNISSLLGKQYALNDPRRNSAFTIFYLGITTGIILGTTLPSKLQLWFGWQACFFSAAIGLILAGFVFFIGTKYLAIQEYAELKGSMFGNWLIALGILLLSYFVFFGVLSHGNMATVFFIAVVIVAVGIALTIAFKEQGDQRKKTLSLLILFLISTFFWAFYFEMFMLLTLFITRTVQPMLLGIHFPAPYYVTVESFGMIIFGLLLSRLWLRLQYKNIAFAISIKFMIAIMFMLLAYLIILLSSRGYASANLLSPWPILMAYLCISLAELMLSPIGLAAVTYLASPNAVSTLMGIFFVSLGIGSFLSGQLAKVAAIQSQTEALMQVKMQYFHGFLILTAMLVGVLLMTYASCLLIRRISRSIRWEEVRE